MSNKILLAVYIFTGYSMAECKNHTFVFKTVFAQSSLYENKVLSPNLSKLVPAGIKVNTT